MFVEPSVTRAKFDRELSDFKAQRQAYLQRGIWLLDDAFPELLFALVAAKTKPSPFVLYGVAINFENYDVVPPSVRFVDPFTRQPLVRAQVVHSMPKFAARLAPDGSPVSDHDGSQVVDFEADLIQAEDPARPGFICLQGVREYHDHPAHTGDSWFLHRGTGVGRLAYVLNALASHGIDHVVGVNYQFQVKVGVNVEPWL